MYSVLYELFFTLKRIQKKKRESGKPESPFIQKVIDYIEWYYNIFLKRIWQKYPSSKYGITKEKRNQKVIVSLTSYPKRISTVWLTIETLLRQRMKPDMIILWLANEQFPNGLEDLPSNLTVLQNRGLTIRFCDDIRSHKKYYYVMQEFPEDLIILTDDDAFYTKDLVSELIRMHSENPHEIVCMTPAIMTGIDKLPSQWRSPYYDEKVEHSMYAQPYTGQGTLYPPHCLDESEVFNKKLIMELCPTADDLWLFYMAMRKRTFTTSIYRFRSIPITIYTTSLTSLWYINAEDGQNDVQWKKMLEFYHDDLKEYEYE